MLQEFQFFASIKDKPFQDLVRIFPILPVYFYTRENVVEIAKELIGKILISTINGKLTGGIICETEAYAGTSDKACHAYNFRRTPKNEVMYWKGGCAYVYFTYGLHYLFNVVTNLENIPEAVLIRGIIPITGFDTILKRRKKTYLYEEICIGPACVTEALAITKKHNGSSLLKGPIFILNNDIIHIPPSIIENTPRIGVEYAQEDSLLPYRFVIKKKFIKEIANSIFPKSYL